MAVNTNNLTNTLKRPSSITVVSLFYWLNAVALAAVGVIAVFVWIAPYFDGTLPPGQVLEDISGILLLSGLFLGILALAIFTAVVGTGLWQLRNWARRAAIVISSLLIVVNMGVFVNGLISGQVVIPYGIVLHGLVLWVLTSMSARAVFEPMRTEPDTPISEKELEKEQDINLKTGMTCSNCGNAVLPKDRFCRKCGYALQ
jgi:hypothetical protein